jgi:hypothetical protein
MVQARIAEFASDYKSCRSAAAACQNEPGRLQYDRTRSAELEHKDSHMERASYPKRALSAGIAMLAIGFVGAKFITQDEALVSGALTELKFELQPTKGGLVGAPPRLKVGKQTIDHLQKLMKEGRVIEVQGNGQLKIK